MRREVKERCCDAKWLLLDAVRGKETVEGEEEGWGERQRQSCCEVKQLLDMWGVPTLFKNPYNPHEVQTYMREMLTPKACDLC